VNEPEGASGANWRPVTSRILKFSVGESAFFALNALTLAILSRGMDGESFGRLALVQSLNLLAVPVVQAGLVRTSPLFLREYGTATVVRAAIRLRLLAALFCLIVLATVSTQLPGPTGLVLLASVPALFAHALQVEFVLIGSGNAGALAVARITAAVLYCGASILLTQGRAPVWTIPLAQAVALGIGGAIMWRAVLPIGPSAGRGRELERRLLWSGGLVTAGQFVQAGYYNSDVLLLGLYYPAALTAIGEYSLVSRITQLTAIPLIAVLYTSIPFLAEAFHQKDRRILRTTERTLRISSWMIGAAGALALFWILPTAAGLLTGRTIS
jgi:O-antigen/teichoic acid export membrane protein